MLSLVHMLCFMFPGLEYLLLTLLSGETLISLPNLGREGAYLERLSGEAMVPYWSN